ncbi:helix-turn-helix domain-containing protein [Thermodesulforhabdus norvegica]|uniref:Transcriptional regulator, XRE family with cupin sensor n=1 Tax=Thermodesulforhabdus norvegica TaxID=39841 RepID=A0A1I4VFL6_9BACT|nr:XRE family transcriptional regulator [Thermodesulforhabdus norvegica]SFM99916.1 transcriptional regulator, XRE family with cupin sensor [Thermodesulforhabdus norvegica]
MPDDHDVSVAVKALKIGTKVKELRMKHRYTLQDLANKTGLSKPFLSQIENNHVIPPVATLLKLARALNVGLGYFFQDETTTEKVSITRKHERIRVKRRPHHGKEDVSYIYESLETRKQDKHMEPFFVEFPPISVEEMNFTTHEGEEFLYVLEGKVEFRTVDRVEILEEGDSIYFDSSISHGFRCVGDKPAKAIAVIWTGP